MLPFNGSLQGQLPSGRASPCSISNWITLSFLTNFTPVTTMFWSTSATTGLSDQYLSESGPSPSSHLHRQYEQCQKAHLHQLSTLILSAIGERVTEVPYKAL